MSPEQLIATVRDLGMAVATAIGLAYFLYKAVWPFVTKQVEDNKAAREQERAQFLTALERRDAEFGRLVNAMQELTLAVREIQHGLASAER